MVDFQHLDIIIFFCKSLELLSKDLVRVELISKDNSKEISVAKQTGYHLESFDFLNRTILLKDDGFVYESDKKSTYYKSWLPVNINDRAEMILRQPWRMVVSKQ